MRKGESETAKRGEKQMREVETVHRAATIMPAGDTRTRERCDARSDDDGMMTTSAAMAE